MAHYIYVLRLVREGAFGSLTAEEEAVVGSHFEFLRAMADAGVIEMAGPCLDGAFGLTLLEAADDEEALRVMEADPAVQHGVMTAELHPFRVSVRRRGM